MAAPWKLVDNVWRPAVSTWDHRVRRGNAGWTKWFTIREVHYANRQIVGWTAEEAPGGAERLPS